MFFVREFVVPARTHGCCPQLADIAGADCKTVSSAELGV